MNKKNIKKKVVVLFGGDSSEREVSLESGRNICYKLSPSKYEVIPVFVDEMMNLYKLSSRLLIQNSTREIKNLVTKKIQIRWADLPKICDFVFIALHGGSGENGNIQGALEMLGLPYNGSGILASSLCMDKYQTNNFLRKKGFAVPKSFLIFRENFQEHKKNKIKKDFFDLYLKKISFPVILKPHDDGCSMLVKKAKNRNELKKELQFSFSTGKTAVMLEEYIKGVELTCGVLGNKKVTVLPPSQVVAAHGILSIEEKFLPGAGENQTPAQLPASAIKLIRDMMKNVYVELGCKGYSRIDCFYQDAKNSPTKKERVVILEINTLPGMTPATCFFHQAAEVGIKPMELVDKIVELGFEKFGISRLNLESSHHRFSKKIVKL